MGCIRSLRAAVREEQAEVAGPEGATGWTAWSHKVPKVRHVVTVTIEVRIVDKDVRLGAGDKTAAVAALPPPAEQAAVADKAGQEAEAKVAART